MALSLGILDQSLVVAGATPAAAIAASQAMVCRAERLGYARYWFAEHHGRRGFGDATPELMIAYAAARTNRIRLGSGGVLLAHYSALKVAETFRMLEALAPGRVDLGLGRASGSDRIAEFALRGDVPEPSYEAKLAELQAFLDGAFDADHPYAAIAVTPAVGTVPPIWLLGSSAHSARLAAVLGLPFAYAHFIAGDAIAITRGYRERYRPSPRHPEPHVALAAAVFCSPEREERDDYRRALGLWRARVRLEAEPAFPSSREARAHRPTAEQQPYLLETERLVLAAPPETIAADLRALAERHSADELLLITNAPTYAAREHSFEEIAAAMGLPPLR